MIIYSKDIRLKKNKYFTSSLTTNSLSWFPIGIVFEWHKKGRDDHHGFRFRIDLFFSFEFGWYDSRHSEYFDLEEAVKNDDKNKIAEIKKDLHPETFKDMMKRINEK